MHGIRNLTIIDSSESENEQLFNAITDIDEEADRIEIGSLEQGLVASAQDDFLEEITALELSDISDSTTLLELVSIDSHPALSVLPTFNSGIFSCMPTN